jgi:PAS domain S-box-containing protein
VGLVGLACYIGGVIGRLVHFPEIGSALFFPPFAILTVALLFSPVRHWPAYVAAGFVAHQLAGLGYWPAARVAFLDLANIVRAIVAAAGLRRFAPILPRFDNVRTTAIFLAVAGLMAPAIAALIGAAIVAVYDGGPYWSLWRTWFLSNALTGIVLLPLLIAGVARFPRLVVWPSWPRTIEAIVLLGGLAAFAPFSFAAPTSDIINVSMRLHAPLLFLIWAALRFGVLGVSGSLLVVSIAAAADAVRGTGPFAGMATADSVAYLHMFLLTAAIPLMLVGALVREREAAGRALAESQRRYRLASTAGVTGVWDWTFQSDEIYIDPVIKKTLGYSEHDLRHARDWQALIHPDDLAHVTSLAQAHYDGRTALYEVEPRMFHKDGSIRWIHARGTLIRGRNGQPERFIGTGSDVTDRKRAELLAEEQLRELARLNRAVTLGELSGALAHELNQPLTAILTNADAARRFLARDPSNLAPVRQSLDEIITADRRAADVIRRLRALLKQGEAIRQPLDLNDLIREAMGLAQGDLTARNVRVEVSLASELPPVVGDRVQLQQVLLNLVLNACDAMAATPTGRQVIVTTAAEEPDGVRVSVSDAGPGVPADKIDRLFEPFFTSKPDGLGLGLTICRSIVTAHGGRLWLTNNADRGATFHFLLPVVTSP